MKKQNGITLIALIITIIVMLILVGVSVTVALNGGLFTTAQDAADRTRAERDNELNYLTTEVDKWVSGTGSVTAVTFTVAGGKSLSDLDPENDIGTVVTASNDEEFYYIGTENGKVKLLAAKCVNTSENKQSDSYTRVAYDEGGYDEISDSYLKPDGITPVSNVYENASIKKLVDKYVTETLGLEADKGRLMSRSEAEDLHTGHPGILYGTTIKYNYWIEPSGYPGGTTADCVSADRNAVVTGAIIMAPNEMGLRPVVSIPLSLE